jgi:hypothetical protein
VLNTHNEVADAVFPKPGTRPLDRVANLVVVAAPKKLMSQGTNLKLVQRLLNGEFFS